MSKPKSAQIGVLMPRGTPGGKEEAMNEQAAGYEIPEMVTVKEAHERSGLSMEYLTAAFLSGEIVGIRCGRKRLINWPKLVAHMNGEC